MLRPVFAIVLALSLLAPTTAAERFKLQEAAGGVEVKLDGKLFTRYLMKSGAKPILWPVLGPTGAEMTRGYPMRKATELEKSDHVHHRSFWFTHGDVNGIDFWAEQKSGRKGGKFGNILHREVLQATGGEQAVIKTRNDWVGPDGKPILEDIRTLTFSVNEAGQRIIDYDSVINARYGQVKFGDTKEGSFGVRVAGSMRTELKKGGTIISSKGDTNAGAWGKQAEWVDYFGPVGGDTAGVAILNHPSSFRYPTYWHVRTYGLFAANCFGLHHFKRNNKLDGSHTMKKGDSIEFHFRVVFHKGNEKQAKIAEQFKAYAKLKK